MHCEQEMQMLKKEHQSMDEQLSLSKQQLYHAQEEGQQQLKDLQDIERQLAEAAAKLRDAEQLKASYEAQLKEAKAELQAKSEILDSGALWKTEAENHRAALRNSEQRCDDQQQKLQQVRRHAAEVERQRKELARNSGLQARQRICEELETALSEKAAMEKRCKKAQRVTTEEQRLRSSLAQEMEAAASELKVFKEEALELSRAKEQLQKQRRLAKSEAGQSETFQAQFNEAEQQRRALQVELAKSQRLRQEEQKRRQAAIAERDQTQHELQQLVQSLRQEGGRHQWAPVLRAGPQPKMFDTSVDGISQKEANGERLLEMIEVAQERAVQRRHLSDATEEVREQARALEELLTKEQCILTNTIH